jgi:hypothetical protein
MKKLLLLLLVLCLPATYGLNTVHSQALLKKIKDKAADKVADKVVDKVFGEENNENTNSQNSNPAESSNDANNSSSGSKMQNTQGGGLNNDGPDVQANIKSAQDAFAAKNYTDARYSVRQAIMGIELQLGKNVLKSYPEKVDGLSYSAEQDKVTSTGIGFAGLYIQRIYESDSKQFTVTVQNDATTFTAVNMYLNGSYASYGQGENTKQLKFKTYKAVLSFDQSSGYTLSVPFGQSSLLVIQAVNYANENAMMAAANQIDIEKIKSELGEK